MRPLPDALRIARFDPTPCDFPSPRVSLLPRSGAWSGRGPASVFLGEGNLFFSRGRYALKSALSALAFGPGDVLLAPSYHCRTMLDPALDLGGRVMLYPLTSSLAVSMEGLEERVSGCLDAVKALLLPHYFGFPQAMADLVSFCGRNGIVLIEDCSHAFFGSSDLGPVGSAGDYAIASPYKFFPCEDGGILRQNKDIRVGGGGPQPPSRRNWKSELRAGITLLNQRFGGSKPVVLPRSCDLPALLPPSAIEQEEDGAIPSCHYVRTEAVQWGTHASDWIIHHADRAHMADARRARFADWLSIVSGLPRGRPLIKSLPDGVVPYMFPFLLDDPETDFYRLKQLGMPIWRWDDMALSSCPVAAAYRKRLIHLPCHQGLGDEEMDWMKRVMKTVLLRCS